MNNDNVEEGGGEGRESALNNETVEEGGEGKREII